MSLQGVRFRQVASGWQPYAPTRSLDPGQTIPWRRLVNLRAHDGHLEWRAALRRLIPSGSLIEPPFGYSSKIRVMPILHVFQAETGYSQTVGGISYPVFGTVVVTATDIYIWDGSWQVATPIYDTGTINASAGVSTVTGVGTDWLDRVINPGNQIKIGSQWVQVQAVASNTSMTVDPAPSSGHSGSYQIRRCFNLTSNVGNELLTDLRELYAVMHNGDLYVAGTYAGGAWPAVVKVTNPFSGAPVTTYLTAAVDLTGSLDVVGMSRIVGLDVLQDGRVVVATQEINQRVARLRFSDLATQTIWNTAPGGFVDDVSGGNGAMTAFHRFGDLWTLHYDNAITLGFLTGLADRPFELRSTRADCGTHYPRSVVKAGGLQYYLSRFGSIYVFDGTTSRRIDVSGYDDTSDRDRSVPAWAIHAAHNRLRNEVTFHLWATTASNNANAIVLSLDDGKNRLESYPVAVTATCSPALAVPGDNASAYLETKSRGETLWGFTAPLASPFDAALGHLVERWGEDEASSLPSGYGLPEAAWADTDYISPQGLATVPHEVQVRIKKPVGILNSATSDVLQVAFSSDGGLTYPTGLTKSKTVTYSSAGESQLVRFFGFTAIGHESWRMRLRITSTNDRFVGAIESIEVLMSPVGAIGATP